MSSSLPDSINSADISESEDLFFADINVIIQISKLQPFWYVKKLWKVDYIWIWCKRNQSSYADKLFVS